MEPPSNLLDIVAENGGRGNTEGAVCTVCMIGQHFQQSMDQPSVVANPARGQQAQEIVLFLSPFEPENLVSRDGFGRPVPC